MPAVDLIGKLFLQRQVCISTGNRQCKWEIAMYRLHGEAVAARCKCRAVGIKVSADIYLLVGKLVDLQSHMIREFARRMCTERTRYRIWIICEDLLLCVKLTVWIRQLVGDVTQG